MQQLTGPPHQRPVAVRAGRAVQRDGHLQRGDGRVPGRAVQGPHVLHVDALHLADLGQEQVHQALLGQVHDQFVHGASGAALDDVDADHVAAHRADARGDGSERTGTVGEPDADDEGGHDANVPAPCVEAVSCP